MAYEKPKCECGNELILYTQSIHGNITKILKNGNFSLKSKSYYEKRDLNPRLKCEECQREYEVANDNKGRIMRGDLFYSGELELEVGEIQ